MSWDVLIFGVVVVHISVVESDEIGFFHLVSVVGGSCEVNYFGRMKASQFKHIKIMENSWRW